MNYSNVENNLLTQMSAVGQVLTSDDWEQNEKEQGDDTLNNIALAIKRQGGV